MLTYKDAKQQRDAETPLREAAKEMISQRDRDVILRSHNVLDVE